MNLTLSRPLPTVVGVIFALGWPLALAALVPHQDLANLAQDLTVLICEWISVLVLFAIVTRWERLPFFSSVGLARPSALDLALVGLIAGIGFAIAVVLSKQHVAMPAKNTLLGQVVAVPLGLRIALVFTAGICEELLFRGYAIARLTRFTGNVWTAALVATLCFTLAHLPRYGLSGGLFAVAIIGAILSALFVWRRNVTACIALHWLIDGISLLIVPAFVTIR